MNDNWWPDLMRYVENEHPWSEPQVVVAEIRGYDDPYIQGLRFLWSALVSSEDLERLDGKLVGFNYKVEANGPRPDIRGAYHPRFWISATDGTARIQCEPLILGWESNNRTAMVLDPCFAMTYGLMPRALADGSVHWDNPAAPEYDVAIIDAPSVYADCRQSDARAVISRDYLQDYLTLRRRHLVHVYYETRRGPRDAAIEAMLCGQERRIERLHDREVDIMRDQQGGYTAQVWGARLVASPHDLPISSDPLDTIGLVWPGIDEPVTNRLARSFRPMEGIVYVRDNVLAAYEGKPGFSVSATSGGVAFGNQWAVTSTTRIGRDVIRLEVRKLYEGTPNRVIQHWHDYAVAPTPLMLLPESRLERNVGTRSKALVDKLTVVGQLLCGLSAKLGLSGKCVEDFVGLDPQKLAYEGWWNGPHVEPITRHIPVQMGRDEFLQRCQALDKVLIEALGERSLRPLVKAIGPQPETDSFRGMKLLDRILCLVQAANTSGLTLWESAEAVLERFRTEGTDPAQPIVKLFALSDLRQLASHRKDPDIIVPSALKRFGIDLAETADGWGRVLDRIYDGLAEQLEEVERTLLRATDN